mmetsp:Transcript_85878/g.237889  ORF Transcript_85878/g.237889 Transcript_85878/m.237889 type:complete len:221 (+) Transcript_85878:57-719(+)
MHRRDVGEKDPLPRLRQRHSPRAGRDLRIGPVRDLRLVDQVPVRGLRRYHMRFTAICLHHRSQRQLVTPGAVARHVLQVRPELISTLEEHTKEVLVLLHVRHSCLPGHGVVRLLTEEVEGQGPKLAVAIALHLLHLHAARPQAPLQAVAAALARRGHVPQAEDELLLGGRLQGGDAAAHATEGTPVSLGLQHHVAADLTAHAGSSSCTLVEDLVLRQLPR